MSNTKLNIRPIKNFVADRISRKHVLYQIILKEQDLLEPNEFVIKLDIWLKLLAEEMNIERI